jgi:multidrug efflux pump subunit AcrB
VSLASFSVRQNVLVNLVFALLMLAGVMISQRIPVDLYPDISFNTAQINTRWSGASPGEVERLLTRKLEDEIERVDGIKELYSYSSHGISAITVEWKESLSDLDYEAAVNDLRAAIDQAEDLPEDADTPLVTELSVSEVYNVVMIAISDVGGVGEHTIREVARDLSDRVERIPGVRKAQLRGDRDRELQVLVDQDRAFQYDLTLGEIAAVIERNNQNIPGGTFTDPGRQEITVRGLGNFLSAADLSRTVVRKNTDGSHVLLGGVAVVEDDFEKRRIYARHNGHPTIILGVSKDADTDIIDVVARVAEYVGTYAPNLPDGVAAELTWDSSKFVEARIGILRSNLALGVVLVIIVLWLSVGFRNAMLAIVGVPFSFLTALILFPIFDLTINSLSLVGFVMVSGMLVDDAIIILENIYRHIEEGRPLREAVVRGTEEVTWPVTAAIATTMAAFIPMLTVSGTSGQFMAILPKTVIVCLLGSLLEALVILPVHYLDFGSRRRASDVLAEGTKKTGIVGWSYAARARTDAAIHGLREVYLVAQARVLQHRGAFLALCGAGFFFAMGLSRHLPVDLFPTDFNQLRIAVETPPDHGIDQTDAVVRDLEGLMGEISDELTDVTVYSGIGMDANQRPVIGVNRGTLFLSFPTTPDNLADPDRVLNMVRERVEAYRRAHPARFENLRVVPPRQGPQIGKPVAIRIQSADYGVAKQIAEEMKAELATLVGVYNIEDNVPAGPRELRVALDEHRASLHGLTFEDVGLTLMAANDGVVPSTFKDPNSDEDVDIRVLLRAEQRRSIDDLLDVDVRARNGNLIKLADVASIELERGYQQLYHFDAERAVVVYADVDNEQATSVTVNQSMRATFRDVPQRYPGTNLVFGGEYQATDDAFSDMGRAFFLAIVAIYGILAAQFRSYTQPLIVMSVILFSFIGVTLGMFVLGYAMSMYVLYAIVGLAGIVVNDSLVLIDFVNRERKRGTPALEAVRLSSSWRFRPILLTTLTTILGLLPMALGLSGYSRVFGPFATAIVFGLAMASLLTLFVVPTLYLTVDSLGESLRSRIRGSGGSREPARSGVGLATGGS